MLPRRIRDWRRHWRLETAGLLAVEAGILLLAGALLLQLLLPVRLNLGLDANLPAGELERLSLRPSPTDTPAIERPASFSLRPGLFKSATAIADKPMADKTVERIRSQLKLQCIMEVNGEPVAYVNIKNVGLKRCRVGESVADLFTVLNIYPKSVEISIVDHRTTLGL